jgi:hypothetical protein
MSSSGVVSKKLKFKGDKPKKKKRSHRETGDDGDELAAMAAGDPRGERGRRSSSHTEGETRGEWNADELLILLQVGSFRKM